MTMPDRLLALAFSLIVAALIIGLAAELLQRAGGFR